MEDLNTIADLLGMDMDVHHYHLDEDATYHTNTTDLFQLAKTAQQKSYHQTQQSRLNNMKTILRPIKDTHVLYVCSEQQWKQKVHNYLRLMDVFSYRGAMPSKNHSNSLPDVLHTMKNQIMKTLHELYTTQAITNEQYEQMTYFQQSTKLEVNKLDFILELCQNEIVLQPTITCSAREPITKLTHFINSLLQPLIERVIHSSCTLSTGYEAIHALENYTQQGYLQSTTRLVKLDLYHLTTTLSHRVLMDRLEKFLHFNVPHGHINGTSTTTIIRLVQLILDHQFCVYENHLYQQMLGGSITSSLIMGLVDIYLHDLLHELYLLLVKNKEFFGRSFNHLIFTWNDSNEELFRLLDPINLIHSQTTHIPIIVTVDNKIQYLDAQLSHNQGVLHTKVYHHADLEPDALPYVFGTTSTRSPVTLLRAAYLRAFLYCSNVIEFEVERMYIDCSFRNNDLAWNCIYETFQNLLMEFNQSMPGDALIDAHTYQILRERIRQYQQKQIIYHRRQRQRRQRRIFRKN